MKILKIRMKNLASFAGEKIIDFEDGPLYKADLFAIVGPTGSGKSTILDAICLALYGKTPRFASAEDSKPYLEQDDSNRLHPNDSRNILRNGSRDGYAEATFLVDNTRYRALWSCSVVEKSTRRKKSDQLVTDESKPKKKLEMQRAVQKLYRSDLKDGTYDEEVEIDNHVIGLRGKDIFKVEQVIGLSYEQFTRTVMLAQNGFADFLKSDDENKALILEKLTNTEIFSVIARKIIELNKNASDEFEEVKRRYDSYSSNLLSSDEKDQAEIQLKGYNEEISAIDEILKQLEASVNWLDVLGQLNGQKEDTLTLFNQAQTAYDKDAEARASLDLYDTLNPVKDMFSECSRLCEDIGNRQKKLVELQKRIQSAEDTLNISQDSLSCSNNIFLQKDSERKLQLPIINKARVEKVNADNKRSVMSSAKLALAVASKNIGREKKELDLKNKEKEQLEENANTQQKIIDSLAVHETMLIQVETVLLKLNTLKNDQQEYVIESKSIDDEQNEICSEEKNLDISKANIDNIKKEITAWKFQFNIEKDFIKDKNLNDIQNRLSRSVEKASDFKEIVQLYKSISDSAAAISSNETKIESEQKLCNADDETRQNILHEIEILTGERDELRAAAAESAESMRTVLEEGKPCPVCGAIHHPYLEKGLSVFRNLLTKKENEIKEKNSQKDKLNTIIKIHDDVMSNCRGVIKTSQKQLDEHKIKWNDFLAQYSEISQAGDDMLRDMLTVTEVHRENFQKEFDTYSQHNAEATKLQDAINKKSDNFEKINDEYKGNSEKLSNRKAAINTRCDNQYRRNNEIEKMKSELCFIISLAEWKTLWNENPQGVITAITSINTAFCEAKVKKEKASAEMGKLVVKIEEGRIQIEKMYSDEREKKQIYEDSLQAYNCCKEEYLKLLNGEDPDAVEQKLNKAVDDAKTDVGTFQKKRDESNDAFKSLQGEEKSLKETESADKERLSTKQKEMDTWLDEYNSDISHQHVDLALLADFYSDNYDWITRKKQVDTLTSGLLKSRSAFEQVEKSIENHLSLKNSTEKSRDELNNEIIAKKVEKKEKEDLRVAINGRLQAHRDNEKAMSSLFSELKSKRDLYEEWSHLKNGISGNADGKTARNAVQCYSLQYLVFQANDQLRYLNRRYSLEAVEGTLGVNVIDHDQADLSRSVSSLSGGETFLVSLSLALALSAISAHSVNIENLFIDEGFGTLDTDSLQLVIDALSNLHSMQGKKVGVISHTAEIRERIRAQIQVFKTGVDGSSFVYL